MLRTIDRALAFISLVAAVFLVVLLFTGPGPIGVSGSGGYGGASSSRAQSGAAVFMTAGCGSCHTLKAAGTTGTTGPNLDQARPSAATVRSYVTSGRGSMPAFSGKLSHAQIAAVARYVSKVAGH